MFEFEKLCKEYEKLSYDGRRKILSELSENIMPAIKLVTHGTDSFELLVLAACSADGKLSVEEYSLLKDSTGLDFSYDRSAEMVKTANVKDVQQAADLFVDSFKEISEGIRSEMVSFCLCLCSADNKMKMKEKSFIKKLLK